MDNKYNMDNKFDVDDTKKDEEIEVLELWEPHADEITDAKDRHVKWSKQTTNKLVIVLVALAALLLMGYAVFAQPLAANNKQYVAGEWDIRFTDMKDISSKNGKATSSYRFDATDAYFNVSFTTPGEIVEYELTIENKGNLDVRVASIDIIPEVIENDIITCKVEDIYTGDRLNAKDKKKMRVKIIYNGDVAGKISQDLLIHINYDQV